MSAWARPTTRGQLHFFFVSTSRGSYFMTELLEALSAATAATGDTTELVLDEFPPLRDGCTYVVIPHEFHAWGHPGGFPDARQCARTIALCTENPGTVWFEQTYQLVQQFAAAVSINRSSAAELRRRGVRCESLQLGYSPLWDSWRGDDDVQRPIDVLYLVAADTRRDPILAGLGGDLWPRQCELLVPPLEPRTRPRPDFLKGAEKYHRLRSARILLNLHRTTSSALEWMRFLEAICNGCVVVSEPCRDSDPLVPGEHFIASPVEGIARAVGGLLDDPDQLRLMQQRTYDFVRQAMPMERAAKRLSELAAGLGREQPAEIGPQPGAGGRPLAAAAEQSQAEMRPAEPSPSSEALPAPEALPGSDEAHPTSALVRGRRLLRSIADGSLRVGRRALRILDQTPAYAAMTAPRVTVLSVAVGNGEREVVQALGSIAGSLYPELEVLVLGDDSSRGSSSRLRGFLTEHPRLPAALLHEPVGRGVGHSRNTLAEHARGEYVFILDATGGIYPSTLQRLVTALEAAPHAIFSYSMIAAFDGEEPVELLNSLPWEPERLRSGNWIDAMALIRRTRLFELGGYTVDPRLAGWEDFDLWCRCAEAGGHGVHVPQVLAWRRRSRSVGAPGENGTPAKWALMRERYPQLLA
jgi:hypothetical protein